MPKACPHFKLLSERVTALFAKFASDQVADEAANPLTFQPDLDRLAAFKLLVHGEIEDFLETKAKENLTLLGISMANPTWIRKFPELLSLAVALNKFPTDLIEPDPQKFSNYVNELIVGARSAISKNNGINGDSNIL